MTRARRVERKSLPEFLLAEAEYAFNHARGGDTRSRKDFLIATLAFYSGVDHEDVVEDFATGDFTIYYRDSRRPS